MKHPNDVARSLRRIVGGMRPLTKGEVLVGLAFLAGSSVGIGRAPADAVHAAPVTRPEQVEAMDPAATASLARSYEAAMREVPDRAAFLRASLEQSIARKRILVETLRAADVVSTSDADSAVRALDQVAKGDPDRHRGAVDRGYDEAISRSPRDAGLLRAIKVERAADADLAVEALTLHERERGQDDVDAPRGPGMP